MKNSQALSIDNIIPTLQVFSIFAMGVFFILSQTFG